MQGPPMSMFVRAISGVTPSFATRLMRVVVRLREEAEVDLEVERLHEAALHLRLARVVAHRHERPLGVGAENLLHLHVGAASGVDLHSRAGLDERGHEGLQARLVRDAHEHVLYGHARVDVFHDVQRHNDSFLLPFSLSKSPPPRNGEVQRITPVRLRCGTKELKN